MLQIYTYFRQSAWKMVHSYDEVAKKKYFFNQSE